MNAPLVSLAAEIAPVAAQAEKTRYGRRQCPECAEFFALRSYQQAYCCEAHTRAYQNRLLSEGRAVVTFAKAWRVCRNRKEDKALGARCLNEMVAILDKHNADDRAAGRASAKVLAEILLNSGTAYFDRARPKG